MSNLRVELRMVCIHILYTYDVVGRLRDAQLANVGKLSKDKLHKLDDQDSYVRIGALGRAFQSEQRTVILIDEIDKADIDFPNDLLLELDEQRFEIEETGKSISAKVAPIIFITSNDEKDLPDAFLRRCLFHYVEFPEKPQLIKIVNSHFPSSQEELVDKIIDRFIQLRSQMKQDKGETGKKVSTSELLEWVRVLSHYADPAELEKVMTELLYPGVLLKNWDDYRKYNQEMRSKGKV